MIKRLLKDSVVFGLAGAASRFVSVLLVPVYTRVFGPSEYGLLDLLVTTTFILVLLSGMQVESGVGRSYYESKEAGRNKELIATGLLLYLVGGIPCIIISGLVFQLWLNGYEGITWQEILPLLLTLLPTQFLGYGLLLLRLEWRKSPYMVLALGDTITSVGLSILAVVYLDLGIPGVMWALFISKFAWAALVISYLLRQLKFTWDGKYAKEILAYSIPTVPSAMVGWAQNYANRFILLTTLSLAQVGIFSLAVKVSSMVGLAIVAFQMAWYPYSIEIMGKPGAADKYARMLDYYLVGMFGICAIASVLGDLAVKILATDAYQTAGSLVGFIVMGLFWNGAMSIIIMGVEVTRKTYLGLVGLTLGATINLVTLWAMVSRWGLVAPGITYLSGTFIIVVINLAIAQRQFYIPYRYIVVVVLAGFSGLLPILLYFLPTPTASWSALVINTAIKLLVVCVLYIAIAATILSQADKNKLLQIISGYRNSLARKSRTLGNSN